MISHYSYFIVYKLCLSIGCIQIVKLTCVLHMPESFERFSTKFTDYHIQFIVCPELKLYLA